MPTVYHMNHRPPGAVLIDRRTKWGNPFKIKAGRTRAQVCALFLEYAIDRNRTDTEWLKPLKGKDLVCWCKPKQCHGDTLLTLANDDAGIV